VKALYYVELLGVEAIEVEDFRALKFTNVKSGFMPDSRMSGRIRMARSGASGTMRFMGASGLAAREDTRKVTRRARGVSRVQSRHALANCRALARTAYPIDETPFSQLLLVRRACDTKDCHLFCAANQLTPSGTFRKSISDCTC
jgi:hypothetical protein